MEPPKPSFADRLRESAYAFALDAAWAGLFAVALSGGALLWAALTGADVRIVLVLGGALSAVVFLFALTAAFIIVRRRKTKRLTAVVGKVGFIDRQLQSIRDQAEFLAVASLLAAETKRIGDIFTSQTPKMASFKVLPLEQRLRQTQALANQTARLMDRRTVKFRERVHHFAEVGNRMIGNQDEVIAWQLKRKNNSDNDLTQLIKSSEGLLRSVQESREHQEHWRETLVGEEAATAALDAANQRLASAITEGIAASDAMSAKLQSTMARIQQQISEQKNKALDGATL